MEALVTLPEHATLQRRRFLALRRIERDLHRTELLDTCLASLNRAAELRQWILWMRDKGRVEPTVQRLLAWAEGQALALETKAAVEMDRTALDDLFPEIDDLHDPLGDPGPKHAWAAE